MEIAEHGDAVLRVEVAQRVHHGLRVARIERGDGLVRQDDLRVLDERAGNGHALLLAARKALGALGREVAEVEPVKGPKRPELFGLGPDLQKGREGRDRIDAAHQDVGENIEAAGEIELLEDHAAGRAPVAERLAAQGCDIDVIEDDTAGRGIDQAVDASEQGGLAGAGTPDHTDEGPMFDFNGHVGERRLSAERLSEVLDFEHWSCSLLRRKQQSADYICVTARLQPDDNPQGRNDRTREPVRCYGAVMIPA